jgi:hypothetical protein
VEWLYSSTLALVLGEGSVSGSDLFNPGDADPHLFHSRLVGNHKCSKWHAKEYNVAIVGAITATFRYPAHRQSLSFYCSELQTCTLSAQHTVLCFHITARHVASSHPPASERHRVFQFILKSNQPKHVRTCTQTQAS